MDLLHEEDLLLLGQLLLLLRRLRRHALLGALLGCLIVFSDHVGLTCGGLRLGLIGLELMLTGQVGLL